MVWPTIGAASRWTRSSKPVEVPGLGPSGTPGDLHIHAALLVDSPCECDSKSLPGIEANRREHLLAHAGTSGDAFVGIPSGWPGSGPPAVGQGRRAHEESGLRLLRALFNSRSRMLWPWLPATETLVRNQTSNATASELPRSGAIVDKSSAAARPALLAAPMPRAEICGEVVGVRLPSGHGRTSAGSDLRRP